MGGGVERQCQACLYVLPVEHMVQGSDGFYCKHEPGCQGRQKLGVPPSVLRRGFEIEQRVRASRRVA
jgi:hypothetical protein